MGAGTRIVIDVVVAGVLWLAASINFRRRGATIGAVSGIGVVVAGGVAAVFLDPRLSKLASDGLLKGD
jgi:type IV secretory pathway VirB2 component (pilin)